MFYPEHYTCLSEMSRFIPAAVTATIPRLQSPVRSLVHA